jgi:Flp pilus assembly protein TadG
LDLLLPKVLMFVKITSPRLSGGMAAQAAWLADLCGRLRAINEEGQSLIESAFCLPILMMVAMGIFSFGLVFNNYLILTNAVSIGAQQLAISRGQTTDPCATAAGPVDAASPTLNSKKYVFTFVLNGTTYTGTSCSSGSTTTGAAGNLVQGSSARVTVTYPCSLTIYGVNTVPGCTLTAQTTELIQ